ncbi:MAG: Fis family transcriptional regulator [Epsilonproteobacteria bacterium]|nr:Fis family transcriptional regulator [Campylobacterota bacterium]
MEKLISVNEQVRQIGKGLQLTQSLYVSSLLVGPPATGKRTLIKTLFPDLPWVSGRDPEGLQTALSLENELVITEFDALEDPEAFDFQNKRVIAIADREINPRVADEKFAFIYRMPPLKERPEDIRAFSEYFLNQALEIFSIKGEVELSPSDLDLSRNLHSLRASVYREVLLRNLDEQEIERALYHLFLQHLEGNNAYREHLGILERPMLRAGLERYRSQLKLSEVLGINRNTLRKKLHEYRID